MAYIFSQPRQEPLNFRPGDRFSYVRQCGGWGNGTVLEVRKDIRPGETIIIGRLDCQKEDETYRFNAQNPNFVKGEMTNN